MDVDVDDVEAIVKNTGSRLGKRLPLKGYSFATKKPFSWTGKSTRRIIFLQEGIPSCI